MINVDIEKQKENLKALKEQRKDLINTYKETKSSLIEVRVDELDKIIEDLENKIKENNNSISQPKLNTLSQKQIRKGREAREKMLNKEFTPEDRLNKLNTILKNLEDSFNKNISNGESTSEILKEINVVQNKIKDLKQVDKKVVDNDTINFLEESVKNSFDNSNEEISNTKWINVKFVDSESKHNNKTNQERKLDNLKIKFDGSTGLYEITWEENGEFNRRTHMIDKKLFDKTNEETQEIMEKYKNYSNKDLNVELFLRDFDLKNKTNLQQQYNEDKIGVIYDLKKLSKIKFLTRKEKKEFKLKVKNYVEQNTENKVITSILNRKKIAAAAAVVGISVTASLAMSNVKTSDTGDRSVEAKIDTTEPEIIEDNIVNSSKTFDYFKIAEEIVKQRETLLKKFGPAVLQNGKSEVIETKDENIDLSITNPEPSVEPQLLENQIVVGEKVHLENTDLYYSSNASEPVGNTANLDNKNFKINGFAVTYGQEIFEVKWDGSIEELKEIYGPNCNYMVNIIDENNSQIGWTKFDSINLENQNVKGLTYKR